MKCAKIVQNNSGVLKLYAIKHNSISTWITSHRYNILFVIIKQLLQLLTDCNTINIKQMLQRRLKKQKAK